MNKIPEGYKQTEVGVVIPEEWNVIKLGDLAEIKDGTHQTPKYVDFGVPFYSVENVTRRDFTNTKFISKEEHSLLTKTFRIEKGDVLMTRIGSIGDCIFVDWDVNASFYVSLALLKINDGYSAQYLSFYSKSIFFKKEIELNSLQSAIPKKINLGQISNIRVHIPESLQEQTTIATALSDTDTLIQSMEKLITKKRAIKQGAMQELLKPKEGWVVKKLGKLGSLYGGLSGKSKSDFHDGIYPYIPFMNIMSNTVIDTAYFDYVNLKPGENQNRAQKGDLFFNGSSETPEEVGMCSVLLEDVDTLYLNSFCFGFRLEKESQEDGLYLSYYFRSEFGRELFFSMAQGATRYNLSKNNFLKLEIKLPKPQDQTRIATILSDMDAEISALETKVTKYKQIKQGMMQNLLTGRIRLI